ncbi:MAG: RHS repeat-associated core domain-containing protein, partial [Planctomycetaceae bacterium]|nr:RHS repeat-associated core domain-containing protein [Planctomycetaceae bacterium]
QQVLEETVTDGSDNLVRKVVYTIGHDHISQTTFGPSEPVDGTTLVFHMDGHGSTRILTDLAGTIANLATPQIFHYTAYGQAVNFTMSEAATQYLYSGEQFDSRVGQQYLRARYYNQSTGAFNRLDPFFGNQSDPQSFHKYLYTHGDPISGIDPTGLYNTVSISTSMAMQGFVSSLSGGAIGAAIFNAAGRSAGYGFATGLFGGFGLFMAWKMKRLKPVLREAIIGTGLALSASIVRDAVVDGQLGSFTKYGSEAFEAFSWSAFNHAWDLFGQAQGDPDIDKSPDYLLKGALEAQGIWDELFAGFSVALAVGVDSLALLGAAALGDDTPEVRDAFKSSVADLFGTIIRSAISSIGSLPVGSQKLLRKVPGLRSLSHRQRVQFAENTVEIGTKLAFGTTPFEWVNDHVELLASESVDAIFDSMKTFRQ